MHRLPGTIAVLAIALATVFAIDDGLPRTFLACALQGGNVRMEGDDLRCRYVETSVLRTYLTGTTECGEELTFDAWGETRRGVVTYASDPGRTEVLPEITDEGIPEMPMPCLKDPDGAGD